MSERGDGRPTNNMPEMFRILTTELKGYMRSAGAGGTEEPDEQQVSRNHASHADPPEEGGGRIQRLVATPHTQLQGRRPAALDVTIVRLRRDEGSPNEARTLLLHPDTM
jgi:hypothetical protein